jgi:hypothetical protein
MGNIPRTAQTKLNIKIKSKFEEKYEIILEN